MAFRSIVVFKFLIKLVAFLIFVPIILGFLVVAAAAAVVAGPMLVEKAKDFMGLTPSTGTE
jgi:hypothetical protein